MTDQGGATALIGGQWGSEGKGVIAAALASGFDAAVRVGGPNAGHSLIYEGDIYKMRGIPCAWVNPKAQLFIGPGAVVDPHLLREELNLLPERVTLTIDAQAVVVTPEMQDEEHAADLWKKVGSTLEGVGAARVAKIRRTEGRSILADLYEDWHPRVRVMDDVPRYLWGLMHYGQMQVMLEGTQGSGLSLHHGAYPFVTSSDTNASGLAAEAGVAPEDVRHVLMVVRTLPIRVAGNSGPMGEELTWEDIQREVPGLVPEQTTVTKRIRRISRWDQYVFERAVHLNRPCGVFLTFTDYLSPDTIGSTDAKEVAKGENALGSVARLTRLIEQGSGAPVMAYGTGGNDWALAWRTPVCRHGKEIPGAVQAMLATKAPA